MSLNLLHIAEGWAKNFKLMKVSDENQQLSKARLEQCAKCEFAKESKALEIIHGSFEKVDIIYCTACTCPCHEKSLVESEECPKNKWSN